MAYYDDHLETKENTPMYGELQTTSGREVNMFPTMSAETC